MQESETDEPRLGIFGYVIAAANARDLGEWDAIDPEIRQWYPTGHGIVFLSRSRYVFCYVHSRAGSDHIRR
jgi:hypothetical protein